MKITQQDLRKMIVESLQEMESEKRLEKGDPVVKVIYDELLLFKGRLENKLTKDKFVLSPAYKIILDAIRNIEDLLYHGIK